MTIKQQRIDDGIELTHSKHLPGKNIFVISDLHLEHENIISYCKRPFGSVHEMDAVLIKNWNYVIKPEDTVYFVGDMTHEISSDKYIPILNGNIHFIWGNHDATSDPDSNEKFIEYSFKGIEFLFIHDPEIEYPESIDYPAMSPLNYNGWVIYGHHHNNDLKKFPFFDPEKKRINVGVELVKYQPVSLDYICSLITEGHEKITSL